MGESHNNHHRPTPSSAASRLGLGIRTSSSTASEIVEARGHILRATGRKDRHSKVCTAKGPRDRRVRLAAHTAIQFYDVQDRLGYDRPSKAVDWLIKKAKAAIDELEELPPWNPSSAQTSSPPVVPISATQDTQNASHHHRFSMVEAPVSSPGNRRAPMVGSGVAELVNHNSSNFLPPSMDSDSIADTIKSFFPMGAATAAETPSFHHSYPPDLLSRTSSQSQDLRLSLHPFQDPILLHHHHNHHHHHHQNEQAFLSGTANPLGFDGSSATWTEHQQHQHQHQQAELNRFQRLMTWNNAGADSNNNSGAGAGAGGFTFNSLPLTQTQTQTQTQSPTLQPFLFGQSQFFSSQRGPLQSSNTPSIHAWIDHNDPSSISDHHHHQMAPSIHHQSSISGLGFASGGFPGFHIPARIQGEEEHDGISDKPSSASSNSRH